MVIYKNKVIKALLDTAESYENGKYTVSDKSPLCVLNQNYQDNYGNAAFCKACILSIFDIDGMACMYRLLPAQDSKDMSKHLSVIYSKMFKEFAHEIKIYNKDLIIGEFRSAKYSDLRKKFIKINEKYYRLSLNNNKS